jgi:hypothetical protein
MANAEERPAEDAMFGSPPAATTEEAPAPTERQAASAETQTAPAISQPAPAESQDARDSLNLGSPSGDTRFSSEVAPDDPLKMGGQWYWRITSSGKQDQALKNWGLSAPALLDMYLDARPNERVRAFALGRLRYDPTLPPNGTTSTTAAQSTGGATQGLDAISQGQGTRGPDAFLDQLWLRFDLRRTLFMTVGKQHVRWGTGRIWAPTDYLHTEARNPLSPFDARTGTTMVKAHLPWEARGWNFYGFAIPESQGATSKAADIAGAARAEIVLGNMEVGLGVLGRRKSKAKFAGDISFGIWDLDFHGEVAVRSAADVDFVHYQTPADSTTCDITQIPTFDQLVSKYFPKSPGEGWKAQAVGGVSYSRQYADKDVFTVGVEYFFNDLGYTTPKDYPGLILPRANALRNPATFFYLGKNYLGAFALLPSPYSWDNTSFTLSSLLNITDLTGITRLDYSLTLLTHLRFEAYVGVHYGSKNGEFRLGMSSADLPRDTCIVIPPFAEPPALIDLGLGLRVAL